eukprot:SAG11_NODE_8339_length_1026_cov_9.155340_1_plen_42_part_10
MGIAIGPFYVRPAYYSGAYTGTYQYRRKKYMSLDLYIKFTTK